MNHRPSLRVQLATIITVVSFLLATMAPLNASPQPIAKAKSSAANPAKPAQSDKADKNGGGQSLNAFVQGFASDGSPFSGLLSINRFVASGGTLNAVGSLTLNLAGQTLPLTVSIPVASIDPSCQILNLILGPLNLNLLGLNVSLNQVILNITATPGNGQLLGNLLCAVANLLNPGSSLSGLLTSLATLLNNILAAL